MIDLIRAAEQVAADLTDSLDPDDLREGLRDLGIYPLGIEWDAEACATRALSDPVYPNKAVGRAGTRRDG